MPTRAPFSCCVVLVACPLAAQVSISPRTVVPADFVRFAVQVANPIDTAILSVHVEVPDALAILGAEPAAGWTMRIVPGTDTTPQSIEWSGGQLGRREFREFAFFARLDPNARRTTLFLPVRIERVGGGVREWRPGGFGQTPEVEIRGSVGVTADGAFTLAAAALGVAGLAVALALRRAPR